jgi:hypothetical protein
VRLATSDRTNIPACNVRLRNNDAWNRQLATRNNMHNHTHTHTHPPPPHTHTHAHTHTRARARTRTRRFAWAQSSCAERNGAEEVDGVGGAVVFTVQGGSRSLLRIGANPSGGPGSADDNDAVGLVRGAPAQARSGGSRLNPLHPQYSRTLKCCPYNSGSSSPDCLESPKSRKLQPAYLRRAGGVLKGNRRRWRTAFEARTFWETTCVVSECQWLPSAD